MTDSGDAGREVSLARTLVMIADTLVGDFDVADLFDRVTTACVELLGATAAGLMIADQDGRLQLMSSSSAGMRTLEELEILQGEGPCLDCYATSTALAVALKTTDAAQRWPVFTAEAAKRGIMGVQALPMRLRGDTIGALNLFHSDVESFDQESTELAQALADIGTVAILHRRALSSTELLAEQLQVALRERIIIEQAKGLLAERGHVHVDQAFAALRDYCRAGRLPLTRTAGEVVSGTRDPDEILGHRSGAPTYRPEGIR